MHRISPSTPLLRSTSTSPQGPLSQTPLRNEELRSILSYLKDGKGDKESAKGLLARFSSSSPLKEHPFSVEKTTEQGDLLVVLTHLLRGSLDDKHSTFKNPSDPSNLRRKNAEHRLGNPEQIAKFKAALKSKLEVFQKKDMKTIGGAVLATGVVVDLINPLHWIGFLKDAMAGHQKNDLGNDKATASFYNAGLRANFIGKKVDQALLDIQKTEEQLALIEKLLSGTPVEKEAAEELKRLSTEEQLALIDTLLSGPPVEKEKAAEELKRLSEDIDHHPRLVDAGAHERLAKLLIDKTATDEAKRIAAGALFNLSTNRANHPSLVDDGARTQLTVFFKTATGEAKKYANNALANLK